MKSAYSRSYPSSPVIGLDALTYVPILEHPSAQTAAWLLIVGLPMYTNAFVHVLH